MQYIAQTLTTDGDGDASVTVAINPGNNFVRRVQYVKTDYADGVDLAITDAASTAVLSVSAMNASAVYCPMQPTHAAADGSASLYASGGEPVEAPIPVVGSLTITIAQGGDTKTGVIKVWIA
jgi:hypothetical protein